jgi:hypothetical protein
MPDADFRDTMSHDFRDDVTVWDKEEERWNDIALNRTPF